MKNTQLCLAARPLGAVKEANFIVNHQVINPLEDNEILVRNLYLSIDPAMRSWMNDGKSYINSVPIGGVMRAFGTGQVVASTHAAYEPGQYICAELGMQTFCHFTEGHLNKPIYNHYGGRPYTLDAAMPLPTHLGALGLPGMTAYFGLLRVGQLRAGETVLISAAAGGVGSIAGQIARIKGCRVIGLTGSDEKCQALEQTFGFDAGLNYKTGKIREKLAEACPKGIDLFFDNVGGDILNAALGALRPGGRVILSGAVSQYNNMRFMQGPANYLALIVNRARMEGFVGTDFYDEFPAARAEIQGWIEGGLLNPATHIVPTSLDTFAGLMGDLFDGRNVGKMVLEVSH